MLTTRHFDFENEMEFTKLEKKLLFKFLKNAAYKMANASCNDFDLPNTPEGIELYELVLNQIGRAHV